MKLLSEKDVALAIKPDREMRQERTFFKEVGLEPFPTKKLTLPEKLKYYGKTRSVLCHSKMTQGKNKKNVQLLPILRGA